MVSFYLRHKKLTEFGQASGWSSNIVVIISLSHSFIIVWQKVFHIPIFLHLWIVYMSSELLYCFFTTVADLWKYICSCDNDKWYWLCQQDYQSIWSVNTDLLFLPWLLPARQSHGLDATPLTNQFIHWHLTEETRTNMSQTRPDLGPPKFLQILNPLKNAD